MVYLEVSDLENIIAICDKHFEEYDIIINRKDINNVKEVIKTISDELLNIVVERVDSTDITMEIEDLVNALDYNDIVLSDLTYLNSLADNIK